MKQRKWEMVADVFGVVSRVYMRQIRKTSIKDTSRSTMLTLRNSQWSNRCSGTSLSLSKTAFTDLFCGRYGVPGDAWDHRMSLDSQADREYPAQGYTSDAVVDAGGSYHQSHPDAQRGYPEEQGYPAQQGYAQPHPDEFASEAEYREYMQHMEDQQREAQGQGQQYAGQGYEDGASSPSGYSSSAAHQQPGYNAPPPGYAGDVPVREEKYTYSR